MHEKQSANCHPFQVHVLPGNGIVVGQQRLCIIPSTEEPRDANAVAFNTSAQSAPNTAVTAREKL